MTNEIIAPKLFLGGTCGTVGHIWREEVIANMVRAGVPQEFLFNPVIPEWNDAAYERELKAKAVADYILIHLADPKEPQRPPHSLYSLTQAIDSAFSPRDTLIYFDTSFLDKRTALNLSKIGEDIEREFPGTVLPDWATFVKAVVALYARNPSLLAFLAGTSGNNKWREKLFAELRARGVLTDRFFDPTVPPDEWNGGVQKLEDQVRRICDAEIFFIGNPMEERLGGSQISPYSVAEAWFALHSKERDRTIVTFDYTSWEGHTLQAMQKVERDMRKKFPDALIFPTLNAATDFLVPHLLAMK